MSSVRGAANDDHDAALYDEVPDAIVVVGADGAVADGNSAAQRILGVPRAEADRAATGRGAAADRPAGRDWWQVTNPFGGLSTRSRQVERVLQLPDGRYVLATASYVRSQRGGSGRAAGHLPARN